MKYIPLTQGKFAIVDDEDYELVSRFKWYAQKNSRGDFYARHSCYLGKLGGKQVFNLIYMHNLIMRPPEGFEVDHKNRDTLGNTRENLRTCSCSQNNMNKCKSRSRVYSSRFKGVSFYRRQQKWRSSIYVNGKSIQLYKGNNEVDAALAYNEAALRYFGEFAVLNKKA